MPGLERGLLISVNVRYAVREEQTLMFGRRAYTIDSCYVAFAVTGRHPWMRSWWQWLWTR
jgi:hypothetical protein